MSKVEAREKLALDAVSTETPREVVGQKLRPRISVADYAKKMVERGYDAQGRFIPDPTPMAPAVGFKESPSMVEIIRRMVRDERLAQDLDATGFETFDEADDFEVGDENADELRSGFENEFEPPAVTAVRDRVEKSRKKVDKPEPVEAPVRPLEAEIEKKGKSG